MAVQLFMAVENCLAETRRAGQPSLFLASKSCFSRHRAAQDHCKDLGSQLYSVLSPVL